MTTQRRSEDGLFVAEDGHGTLTLWRPGDPPEYVPHDEAMRLLERALADLAAARDENERLERTVRLMVAASNASTTEADEQRQRAARAEAALRDFAEHGLRADLMPTMDTRDLWGGFTRYLSRIDEGVRERACAALAEPSQRDGAPTFDQMLRDPATMALIRQGNPQIDDEMTRLERSIQEYRNAPSGTASAPPSQRDGEAAGETRCEHGETKAHGGVVVADDLRGHGPHCYPWDWQYGDNEPRCHHRCPGPRRAADEEPGL